MDGGRPSEEPLSGHDNQHISGISTYSSWISYDPEESTTARSYDAEASTSPAAVPAIGSEPGRHGPSEEQQPSVVQPVICPWQSDISSGNDGDFRPQTPPEVTNSMTERLLPSESGIGAATHAAQDSHGETSRSTPTAKPGIGQRTARFIEMLKNTSSPPVGVDPRVSNTTYDNPADPSLRHDQSNNPHIHVDDYDQDEGHEALTKRFCKGKIP